MIVVLPGPGLRIAATERGAAVPVTSSGGWGGGV
jgi:hypothetical protein